MGNKNSVPPGYRGDPTSRSFSWQQEPGFGPMPVDHFPNPNHPGFKGMPPNYMPLPPGHEYGMLPPKGTDSLGRPRTQSMGNGSVIRDEAMFGGVHPVNQREVHENNENRPSPPYHSPNTNPDSPSKKSRPGTSDSGYFTGMDSDPKMRGKLRGSRLSLNEAVFNEGTFERQFQNGPPPGPPPPHMFPPSPMGPPPFFGPAGPYPPMFEPYMGPVPPDFDSKKMKKWRKKQKKLMRKGSLPRQMPPPPGTYGPPFCPPPGAMPPSPGTMPPFRAQSIDDMMAAGMVQPHMMPGPPPPGMQRRFSSQGDILNGGFYPMPYDTPGSKKGKKDKKGTTTSLVSENASSSGKGSRRSKKEATHFEEERAQLDGQWSMEAAEREKTPFIRTVTSMSEVTKIKGPENQTIYETLKQRQEHQTLVATAEISAEQSEASTPEKAEKKEELPMKILADAQAILDKNAQLYSDEIPNKKKAEISSSESEASAKEEEKTSPEPQEPDHKVPENKQEVVQSDSLSFEPKLEVVRRSMLPRNKSHKPDEFIPLDAWNAIDVTEVIRDRQPQRGDSSVEIQEDRISVRLVAMPPSRKEAPVEPIYAEYNARLPEFKKRLIETGSFDIPAHLGQPQTSEAKTTERETKQYTQFSERPGSRQESAPRPTTLEAKYAAMYGQPTHWKAQNVETFPYASNGSLTPSTANIQAGDQSDIDFSWVHDVENKMKQEGGTQRSLRRTYTGDNYYAAQETPRGQRRDFSLSEATGHSTPTATRAFDFKDREVTESFDSYRQPERTPVDEPMPAHYFGISGPTYSADQRSEGLQHRESNVRAKAAMFETEARRASQEMDTRETQMQRQREHKRSRSVPQRQLLDYSSPSIPYPDYSMQWQQSRRPARHASYTQYYDYDMLRQQPLSVDTTPTNTAPSMGQQRRLYDHFSPASPSERRIRRFELQMNRQTNASMDGSLPSPGSTSSGRVVKQRESRLAAYNTDRARSPSAGRVEPRMYDATEFYRRNCMDQRNREVQEKANKKGWLGSLGRSKKSGSQLSVSSSQVQQQPPSYGSYRHVNGVDMQANVVRSYT